jgi:hypothetical protein
MKQDVIGVCPICTHDLTVTKLSCDHCHTEISGDFRLSRFSYLDKQDLRFIETFLLAEGNIKEVERMLEISYPTVKKMLNNVLARMGYESKVEVVVDEKAILERLKRKEITVEEAKQLLKGK